MYNNFLFRKTIKNNLKKCVFLRFYSQILNKKNKTHSDIFVPWHRLCLKIKNVAILKVNVVIIIGHLLLQVFFYYLLICFAIYYFY